MTAGPSADASAETARPQHGTGRGRGPRVPGSPLLLRRVTQGFAALDGPARAAGSRACTAAEVALAEVLGHAVRLAPVARPSPWAASVGAVRLPFVLGALGEHGVLEVDARLAARCVDLLAGAAAEGMTATALAPTPIELAMAELLALVAMDAAIGDAALAALGPQLVRETRRELGACLAVEVAVNVGAVCGCVRLAIPAAVIGRLSSPTRPELPPTAAALRVPASLRQGHAAIAEAELRALAPGDVVLLASDSHRDELVLPGGFTLLGVRDAASFVVEETRMNQWTASFPLLLSVEVARVEVSLGELSRLEPGGILPLHAPREGTVVLRAGERPVARGRLVEVDGALGISIEALEVPA